MCAVRRREERRASRLAFSPWRPRWLPPHARALFQIPAPARRRHFSEFRAPPQIRLFHARVSTVSPVLQRGDRAEQRDMHKTCIILMHTYACHMHIAQNAVTQERERAAACTCRCDRRTRAARTRTSLLTANGHALKIDGPEEQTGEICQSGVASFNEQQVLSHDGSQA